MGTVRQLALASVIALIATGCGSDAGTQPDVGSTVLPDDSVVVASTGAEASTPTTGATTAPSSGGSGDGTGLDWATLDLTTVDWANIDYYTVDFQAIQNNPTAANLSEEARSLIGEFMPRGSATLTIGDEVWEFDSFQCAFGHENTESAVYAFTTNAFGEHSDGTRVQMQANVRNEAGDGRVEGDGLTHEVFINDIEDFDNPVVDWEMNAPDGITIDGIKVSATGTFVDKTSNGAGEVDGTLDAECGADSRFEG